MIGNPHENINDLMETLEFWIRNNIEVDPFICTPYVGSPIFYEHKDFLLQQYDERLQLLDGKDGSIQKTVSNEDVEKWKLDAVDKFMTECGDATDYTATVSQYFTISDLFAIKNFMHKKDVRRLLQMAHQRYEETKKEYWKHDKKWSEFCSICQAKNQLGLKLEIPPK